jgi:inner membrane protein involved in colicin E2 resistance
MTADVTSTEPVTLCLHIMETRLWDSQRDLRPNFEIQMDLSVSVMRTQGRLSLEEDVIGRLVKDLKGISITRHMDVEGHLLKTNHESEA